MSRILLIEDDAWLADSYRQVLTDHEVEIVSDGQSALDAVDSHKADLIVADIMIRGGTSIDVLHDLVSFSDSLHTPVILCSALGGSVRLEDVRSYGVVEVLDKTTLRPGQLRQAIQRALSETAVHG